MAFLAGVIVNVAIEKKKGEAKLTSICGIVGAVVGLWYIVAWWVADTAKGVRKAEESDGFKFKIWFKVRMITYFIYAIAALAGGAIPTVMGGLAG